MSKIFYNVLAFCGYALGPTVTLCAESSLLELTNSVQRLESAGPKRLAKEAVREGRIKFLGIAGFSVRVPGIDTARCTADPAYVDIVQGTSDVGTSDHRAMQRKAEKLANAYNREIRQHLVKSGTLSSHIVCVSKSGSPPTNDGKK